MSPTENILNSITMCRRNRIIISEHSLDILTENNEVLQISRSWFRLDFPEGNAFLLVNFNAENEVQSFFPLFLEVQSWTKANNTCYQGLPPDSSNNKSLETSSIILEKDEAVQLFVEILKKDEVRTLTGSLGCSLVEEGWVGWLQSPWIWKQVNNFQNHMLKSHRDIYSILLLEAPNEEHAKKCISTRITCRMVQHPWK